MSTKITEGTIRNSPKELSEILLGSSKPAADGVTTLHPSHICEKLAMWFMKFWREQVHPLALVIAHYHQEQSHFVFTAFMMPHFAPTTLR
jgi:hypothetical protein